jgi:glucokinase-like ROK family protein
VDIAKISGLTPATVTNITGELIDIGLISEAQQGESKGGRKPVMLNINSGAFHIIGVYIGTEIIEIALSDLEGKLLSYDMIPNHRGITASEALLMITEKIRNFIKASSKPVIGIGVGVHGIVKSDEGIVIYSPNLGWESVRIKDILESEFQKPVIVDNDVKAMTLGECWFGEAAGFKDFFLLYVGRGIGGSIVIDNKVYRGSSGAAGEIGHSTILPDGPLCSCGNRGCLQSLASNRATVEKYLTWCHQAADVDSVDFDEVLQRAQKNDVAAMRAVLDSARYIGIAIANAINMFNPPLVVISGKISQMGSIVMNEITREVNQRCMKHPQNSARIIFSKSQNEAFLKGAVALVTSGMYQNVQAFLSF